ncbi:MAG: hypothetical protein M5R36_07910 [Deltaproteobacteria bacterium]|nr:hypothetical protein [Deltaproteobacteria bacterium]
MHAPSGVKNRPDKTGQGRVPHLAAGIIVARVVVETVIKIVVWVGIVVGAVIIDIVVIGLRIVIRRFETSSSATSSSSPHEQPVNVPGIKKAKRRDRQEGIRFRVEAHRRTC